tara:strand:- start:706 stop:1167 length:462 start_codon:yes stop_codon:yes gene_type:complete
LEEIHDSLKTGMESMICIQDLGKIYSDGWGRRRFTALEDVSFQSELGHVIGMLGGNCSGKRTLLKLFAGLSRPTSGEIRVGDFSPELANHQSLLGYLPERPTFPGHLSPFRLLTYCVKLSGLDRAHLSDCLDACIEQCGLNPPLITGDSRRIP